MSGPVFIEAPGLADGLQSVGDGLRAIAAALAPQPVDRPQIILDFLNTLDPGRIGAKALENSTMADSPVVAILDALREMVS